METGILPEVFGMKSDGEAASVVLRGGSGLNCRWKGMLLKLDKASPRRIDGWEIPPLIYFLFCLACCRRTVVITSSRVATPIA